MLATKEFKWQDWVKLLLQDSGAQQPTKAHIDPTVVFPFQDDFSDETIHGADAKASTPSTAVAPTGTEVVKIQDNEDNVSVLTAKTTSKAQSKVAFGSRVASGSNPVSGPTVVSTQPGAASRGSDDPASNGLADGAVVGGLMGKYLFITDPSSTSTGGGTSNAQGGLSSEQTTSRRRRSQQFASGHQWKEAASRHHQLLSTCIKLTNLCYYRKFKTTSHPSIMEQLWIKADQFRKQGQLQDQDLEEIINEIKAGKEFKVGEESCNAETVAKDKQKQVLKEVKEGLLQVHRTASNTKQQGIFELWGKTAMAYIIELGVTGKLRRHWTSRKILTLTASYTASIASISGTKRIKMT
jgi:hypothetical protein